MFIRECDDVLRSCQYLRVTLYTSASPPFDQIPQYRPGPRVTKATSRGAPRDGVASFEDGVGEEGAKA